MTRDYPLYIWRNNNSNGKGGLNVLDNIVVFYIFFTIVGFLAAMLGTIIGAGGGLVFVPLFMYWFPEWSPSMVVGTSLFSVMCNAISGSIAQLLKSKAFFLSFPFSKIFKTNQYGCTQHKASKGEHKAFTREPSRHLGT